MRGGHHREGGRREESPRTAERKRLRRPGRGGSDAPVAAAITRPELEARRGRRGDAGGPGPAGRRGLRPPPGSGAAAAALRAVALLGDGGAAVPGPAGSGARQGEAAGA